MTRVVPRVRRASSQACCVVTRVRRDSAYGGVQVVTPVSTSDVRGLTMLNGSGTRRSSSCIPLHIEAHSFGLQRDRRVRSISAYVLSCGAM